MESIESCPDPHVSINGSHVTFIQCWSTAIHGKPFTPNGHITYYYADGTKLTILRGEEKEPAFGV